MLHSYIKQNGSKAAHMGITVALWQLSCKILFITPLLCRCVFRRCS